MLTSEHQRVPLEDVNESDRDSFIALLGDTVENAPWVAENLERQRPFVSIDAIWRLIMDMISDAPVDAQIALFRGHPELAGTEALERRMSSHSTGEQDRLGLASMRPEDVRRLQKLNRQYRDRFDYPCIVALRHQRDLDGLLGMIAERLVNDPQAERLVVLREIGEIVRGRLELRVAEDETHDG